MTREAVIAGGARTPRGKGSPRGKLHGHTPIQLVGHVLGALQTRGLEPQYVGDVILGCATQVDEQGGNIARTAALMAGWPVGVPGLTINRFCASGLEAIKLAASRVIAGDCDIIVAGGVESVSRVATFADKPPLYCDPAIAAQVGSVHMGVAADLVASVERFTRDELDDYADMTRTKARMAQAAGAFAHSIVALPGLAHDELLDGAPQRAALTELPPLFGDRAEDLAIVRERYPQVTVRALHTKGNSPQLADAAAAVVVVEEAAAVRAGLTPRARVLASASCAVDPVVMLTAGELAVHRALARAGLSPNQVDVYSFAEAFSALCLRFMRTFDVGHERFNPNGGTMALGHAYGATGANLVLDVVDELHRRNARYGVAAVSGAAGLGAAIVVERIA